MLSYEIRGTGRTKNQMLLAPFESFYVCQNHNHVKYCENLAKHIRRNDLKVISKDNINLMFFRGFENYVVVDHYTDLLFDQSKIINEHLLLTAWRRNEKRDRIDQ